MLLTPRLPIMTEQMRVTGTEEFLSVIIKRVGLCTMHNCIEYCSICFSTWRSEALLSGIVWQVEEFRHEFVVFFVQLVSIYIDNEVSSRDQILLRIIVNATSL